MGSFHRLIFSVLLSVAGWCVCAAPAAALTYDEVMEQGRSRIAVYADFPPFSNREGSRLVGVDVDIARVVADELGVALDLMELTADESVDDDLRNAVWKGHSLGNGVADLMLHVPYDREFDTRNDMVVLFAPYYEERLVVARDKAKMGVDATLARFAYDKIGVELDTLADIYLMGAFNGRFQANVVHFLKLTEATDALLQGKVAAVMAPLSQVEAGLGPRLGDFDTGRVPTPGLAKDSWLLGVAVKENARDLGYAVADILAAMIQDGRMKAIFAAHGLTYRPPPASFYGGAAQ